MGATVGEDPRASRPETTAPGPGFLRMGTVLAFLGFALQLVASSAHPGHSDPNDSATVFREYAASNVWTSVHLGQFVGGLLVALTLVFIARSLPREGIPGGLALVGGVAAVVWAAIFAIQMAVDGFALKAAIDAWLAAAPADQAAGFLVADGVRAVEKGLSSMFHLMNGTALLTLGLAVSLSGTYPRWLGWFGAAAGFGYIVGGMVVAHTGFAAEGTAVLSSALIPGVVFLFGIAVAMWRNAGASSRDARGSVSEAMA